MSFVYERYFQRSISGSKTKNFTRNSFNFPKLIRIRICLRYNILYLKNCQLSEQNALII